MVLMTMSLFVAGVLVIVGFLVWVALRLFKKRQGRRIFKATGLAIVIIVPIFVFLVSPMLFANLLVNASTRPFDVALDDNPDAYGRSFENVTFQSRDGLNLSGWFLPGEHDRPTWIMSHGLFRNRHEILKRACDLNGEGYPILLFDFRNHRSLEGESGSAGVSLGFQERLDVLGGFDYLRSEKGVSKTVLYGVSMGAVAAIHAAGDIPSHVTAIVADSPFLSLDETVRQHNGLILGMPDFPFCDIFIWNLTRLANYRAEDLDTTKALGRIPQIPVLLLYGENDRRMPRETAEAVLDAVGSSRKRIEYFPEAGHGRSYRADPEKYISTILSFLGSLEEPAALTVD